VIEALTRRQQRFEKSRKYLTDAESSAFFFVLNAERMPILETARAIGLLEKYGIFVGGVVVNRVIPTEVGDFFAVRLVAQEEYLQDIERRFGASARKILRLPLLRSDVQGMEQLEFIADRMGEIDA
jgi:arsenite-transporting ATPase